MAKEIKFTDDELKSLKNLQTRYLDIQQKFGQLAIGRINLNNRINEMDKLELENKKEFDEIVVEESKLVDELTKKYGQGQLDPNTGVFTPNEKPTE
tara:strand:- start:76 stop:363 length:288 start_codon:yes stop_codon:yes gene_type:complete